MTWLHLTQRTTGGSGLGRGTSASSRAGL